MIEHVLVQQVRFIEQQHRVYAFPAKLLDVRADGVEDRGRRRLGREPKSEAELPVEVAPSEGGVVAIRKPEARIGETLPQRAKRAGLADARFAREGDVLSLVDCVDELVDERRAARGQPEVGVVDVLGEGQCVETEVREPACPAHRLSSMGERPMAQASSTPAGSNGTSMPRAGRWALRRCALPLRLASTGRST